MSRARVVAIEGQRSVGQPMVERYLGALMEVTVLEAARRVEVVLADHVEEPAG